LTEWPATGGRRHEELVVQIRLITWKQLWAPAIIAMVLAPVLFATRVNSQNPKSEPEPPPPFAKPSPKPTPTPAADDEYEVIRISSNLVVVPVSVTDDAGQPVHGLKVEDFRLHEEGQERQIAQIGDPEQVPLDIALLLDVSSSVTKNFDFEKRTAAGFLKEVLKPIDRAAIFSISDTPQMTQPLTAAGSATATLLTIPPADKPTGTAFYDTVRAAAKYLEKNAPGRNRRVVLVISDGEDISSEDVRYAMLKEGKAGKTAAEAMEQQRALHAKAVQKVLSDVQHADAVFYSINPSGPGIRMNFISQRANDQMKMLADSTGGNSFLPPKLEDLTSIFQQIAGELRAQYLLQYYAGEEAPKGKFLRIKVSVPTRPELRIRAREGYYVTRK
jgi:Ca-activated chloride channel family protein